MNANQFETLITELFPGITPEQISQFIEAEKAYREWNEKINVISRKDMDGIFAHHLLHSVGIAAYAGARLKGKNILDVGTGGGFPGIPLAILYPDASFTLCDSIRKKTLVAENVAQSIGLKNVKVVNCRAESLPERYDWVVSRAVASLNDFLPWVKGRYKEGILFLKGGDINPEIAAAMARYKLPKGSVKSWKLTQCLKQEQFLGCEDDYLWFEEKFVIEL